MLEFDVALLQLYYRVKQIFFVFEVVVKRVFKVREDKEGEHLTVDERSYYVVINKYWKTYVFVINFLKKLFVHSDFFPLVRGS